MKNFLAAIAVGSSLLVGAMSANAVPLYRGQITPNQTPDQQGWTYLKTPFPTAPTATATSSGTVLDSGATRNYAGYFFQTSSSQQAPFELDRSGNGYALSFKVKINSESHTRDNRAGFSLITISKQLPGETQPFGIEMGFWTDSIWVLNADATRGETVSINTQVARNYLLYIQGNQYKLFIEGSKTAILQGSLRQYTEYTPPAGFPNPYTTPNLIFMGDDTTSATANVTITQMYAAPVTQAR